jgi:hypothetical protein
VIRIGLAVLLALMLPLPGSGARGQAAARVLLVTRSDMAGADASLVAGARFGAEEAARSAALTGRDFGFGVLRLEGGPSAGQRRAYDSASVIISAIPRAELASLFPRRIQPLFLDVGPIPPEIDCDPQVLHLSASGISLRRARLWDAKLEKYGAEQLNERYLRATGRAMDDGAWLGWFATKAALEMSVRARTWDRDSLAHFAHSSRARLDGQKGRALTFDGTTGVLLQPLYESVPDQPGGVAESKSTAALPSCRARAP